MPVIINVKDKRWEGRGIDWAKAAEKALVLGNKGSEVSVTLTNDREIRALNKKYRGMDKPTNVLSFETEDKDILGDVFVSFDAASREAPTDFENHAAHLIVHGVLHLQGFDHMNDIDAEIMERREAGILRKMGIKNPYKERGFRARVKSMFLYAALFLLGASSSYGFAPHYLWPLTVLSIGAAYYFNKGYKTGFWWGAGYGALSFSWSLESIFANAEIARQLWFLYPVGLVGIMIGSGIIFGLPFWMTKETDASGWRRTLYFALAWTFVLWLREWFLTGFPWNPVANIAMESVRLSGVMSFVGALGLTFILIGAICAGPEFLRTRAKWQFLFLVPVILPFFMKEPPHDLSETFVRIVQPSFNMNDKFDRTSADNNIGELIRLSKMGSALPLDLVIWPETAYPYAVNRSVKIYGLGVPLVLGAIYYDDGKFYNSMLELDADGNIIDSYFKSHLVPFGEYRPLGDIIPTPGQLKAGAGPQMMRNFVPAICYEVVFSDSLIPVGAKPDFILNITNDAWFGASKGPDQHLDMARRQAIETGLSIVRANYGGVSAIIDSHGRVLQSLPLGERGVLDGHIPASRETLYRHVGLNKMMIMIILLCGLILAPGYLARVGKMSSSRMV